MVEFRTTAPGEAQEAEGSEGFGLEGHINSVIDNIKNDPETKAQFAQQLIGSDVNPAILRAIDPELGDFVEEAREKNAQEAEAQEAEQSQQVQTVTETVMEKPSVEEIQSIIDELIESHPSGEEATLAELKKFAETSPDTVELLLDNAW